MNLLSAQILLSGPLLLEQLDRDLKRPRRADPPEAAEPERPSFPPTITRQQRRASERQARKNVKPPRPETLRVEP